ncbi:helix-turn-helix domain-containing protein [Sphingobacterium bovisgrunnientis]|uniref:helix-turn-helix domain-containing protein n=1 Tax=Sphingobacterium bovisgrunnientis TaxID=1874697 RepID=UPI0013583A72|nr:helix-turn-helix transcriptional regulator [Sphingobacterium bovisgrunnientis]
MALKEIEYNAEAARFVKFREKMELSQVEIAKILETKQPNISKIEKGERPLTFSMLRILRKKYKLNINWYITGQGTMLNEEEDKSTILADLATIKKDYEDLSKLYDNLRSTVNKLVRDVYSKD